MPTSFIKSSGDFEFVNIYEAPEIFSPWESDGAYYLEGYPSGVNREGVVSLHPYDINKPSYLRQNISLGDGDYIVVATIANLADYTDPCAVACSDNIFMIKITDSNTGAEEKIYDAEITSSQGWRTLYLDISDYKNKAITFSIEGQAGGRCADWCGEWAAVDEFYVGKLV